jgi:hypothetical protein
MLLDRSVAPMSALTQSLIGPKQYFWMFPSQVRRAFMAFIATAVDESADREQRHTFAVAGLCWRHDRWVDLERHWNRCLKKHGIEYFKTSEYLSLNGQFLRFRDKSDYPAPLGRQAAKEIFDDLAQIIRISRGKGIGLVIDLKSWRTIRKSSTAREVFPFKDPYLFAHSALIVYVAGELTGTARGRTVAFLLDSHCKGNKIVSQIGELKRLNPECAPHIGTIGFGDDTKTAQLQAADLIAGVCKEYALNKLGHMKGDPQAKKKEIFATLGGSIGVAVLDDDYLRKVAQANTLSGGRPSIYSTLQSQLFDWR